jgi:hypothetical protein
MAHVFNTAILCDPRFHDMVPPEQRLPEARTLVEQMGWFVVHAPRQTGKSTILRTLARALTSTAPQPPTSRCRSVLTRGEHYRPPPPCRRAKVYERNRARLST